MDQRDRIPIWRPRCVWHRRYLGACVRGCFECVSLFSVIDADAAAVVVEEGDEEKRVGGGAAGRRKWGGRELMGVKAHYGDGLRPGGALSLADQCTFPCAPDLGRRGRGTTGARLCVGAHPETIPCSGDRVGRGCCFRFGLLGMILSRKQ